MSCSQFVKPGAKVVEEWQSHVAITVDEKIVQIGVLLKPDQFPLLVSL